MEFPEVLARAIRDSRLFLFLGSKNSYESKFTNSEITYAFNKKNKQSIIPYLIDRNPLPDSLEFVFSSINWRNIKDHPVELLVDDILQLLNRPVYYDAGYAPVRMTRSSNSKKYAVIAAVAAVVVAAIIYFAIKGDKSATPADDMSRQSVENVEQQNVAAEKNERAPAAEQAAKPSSASVQKSNTQTASNNTPAKQQNPASQQSNTGTSSAPVASPAPAPSQPAKPSQQPVAQPEKLPQQQPAVVQQSGGTQPETSASELVAKGVAAVRKFQPELAVGFFKQAVAKGSVEANYHLGELYYNGNGVDKSFPTAAGYFEKAANAGMAEAQYMLGVMYRNGQGVTKDISTAKTWLMKAAAQGNAKAEQMLNKL